MKEIPMATKRLVAFLLLAITANVIIAQSATAQENIEPLRKAKVGDYVVFKLTGGGVKGTMRQEVTAVTDKSVTIKSTSTTNGITLPASEQTIPLAPKVDPAVEAKNREANKIVDTGNGEETLTIGGKGYKCQWRSNSTTTMQGGTKIVSEAKVWISADAPVYGLVKTETKVFGQTTVMEMIEAGSK
jgi:hypothetical protein